MAHSSRAKKIEAALQNLVGFLEVSDLTLELFHPLLLSTGDTRTLIGVQLGLQLPPPQRLGTNPDLGADRWQAAYTDRYSSR